MRMDRPKYSGTGSGLHMKGPGVYTQLTKEEHRKLLDEIDNLKDELSQSLIARLRADANADAAYRDFEDKHVLALAQLGAEKQKVKESDRIIKEHEARIDKAILDDAYFQEQLSEHQKFEIKMERRLQDLEMRAEADKDIIRTLKAQTLALRNQPKIEAGDYKGLTEQHGALNAENQRLQDLLQVETAARQAAEDRIPQIQADHARALEQVDLMRQEVENDFDMDPFAYMPRRSGTANLADDVIGGDDDWCSLSISSKSSSDHNQSPENRDPNQVSGPVDDLASTPAPQEPIHQGGFPQGRAPQGAPTPQITINEICNEYVDILLPMRPPPPPPQSPSPKTHNHNPFTNWFRTEADAIRLAGHAAGHVWAAGRAAIGQRVPRRRVQAVGPPPNGPQGNNPGPNARGPIGVLMMATDVPGNSQPPSANTGEGKVGPTELKTKINEDDPTAKTQKDLEKQMAVAASFLGPLGPDPPVAPEIARRLSTFIPQGPLMTGEGTAFDTTFLHKGNIVDVAVDPGSRPRTVEGTSQGSPKSAAAPFKSTGDTSTSTGTSPKAASGTSAKSAKSPPTTRSKSEGGSSDLSGTSPKAGNASSTKPSTEVQGASGIPQPESPLPYTQEVGGDDHDVSLYDASPELRKAAGKGKGKGAASQPTTLAKAASASPETVTGSSTAVEDVFGTASGGGLGSPTFLGSLEKKESDKAASNKPGTSQAAADASSATTSSAKRHDPSVTAGKYSSQPSSKAAAPGKMAIKLKPDNPPLKLSDAAQVKGEGKQPAAASDSNFGVTAPADSGIVKQAAGVPPSGSTSGSSPEITKKGSIALPSSPEKPFKEDPQKRASAPTFGSSSGATGSGFRSGSGTSSGSDFGSGFGTGAGFGSGRGSDPGAQGSGFGGSGLGSNPSIADSGSGRGSSIGSGAGGGLGSRSGPSNTGSAPTPDQPADNTSPTQPTTSSPTLPTQTQPAPEDPTLPSPTYIGPIGNPPHPFPSPFANWKSILGALILHLFFYYLIYDTCTERLMWFRANELTRSTISGSIQRSNTEGWMFEEGIGDMILGKTGAEGAGRLVWALGRSWGVSEGPRGWVVPG